MTHPEELRALVEALKPFAEQSRKFDEADDHFGVTTPDYYKPKTYFTRGDLRRARIALTRAEVPDGCLNIGHQVTKRIGYPFPGEVRSVFKTRAGLIRYVVEATGADYSGMLHIFSPEQLSISPQEKK
jgi:hypothetical protein